MQSFNFFKQLADTYSHAYIDQYALQQEYTEMTNIDIQMR